MRNQSSSNVTSQCMQQSLSLISLMFLNFPSSQSQLLQSSRMMQTSRKRLTRSNRISTRGSQRSGSHMPRLALYMETLAPHRSTPYQESSRTMTAHPLRCRCLERVSLAKAEDALDESCTEDAFSPIHVSLSQCLSSFGLLLPSSSSSTSSSSSGPTTREKGGPLPSTRGFAAP